MSQQLSTRVEKTVILNLASYIKEMSTISRREANSTESNSGQFTTADYLEKIIDSHIASRKEREMRLSRDRRGISRPQVTGEQAFGRELSSKRKEFNLNIKGKKVVCMLTNPLVDLGEGRYAVLELDSLKTDIAKGEVLYLIRRCGDNPTRFDFIRQDSVNIKILLKRVYDEDALNKESFGVYTMNLSIDRRYAGTPVFIESYELDRPPVEMASPAQSATVNPIIKVPADSIPLSMRTHHMGVPLGLTMAQAWVTIFKKIIEFFRNLIEKRAQKRLQETNQATETGGVSKELPRPALKM